MCLNRQCQNVSVFGVHECSAKCSGRGVSTSYFSCYSNLKPTSLVYPTSQQGTHTGSFWGCSMLEMPCVQRARSRSKGSQSITLDAERFNQLDVMASFMLSFKCNKSHSRPVVLVPPSHQKKKKNLCWNLRLYVARNARSCDTVWLWAREHGYWIFLKCQPIKRHWVVLFWDEICAAAA